MHAIVSLLPQPYYGLVESIWSQLEAEFGLSGNRVTPFPHFSWVVFEDCQLEEIESAMKAVAEQIPAFAIQTTGISVFTGPIPVIYIPVVKSRDLLEIHRFIWERCSSILHGINEHYAPDTWMPHISLAYQDITEANIGPVINWLVQTDTTWEMTMDTLSFIFEPDGDIGILRNQFPLKNPGTRQFASQGES